jgi:hypothetical protein
VRSRLKAPAVQVPPSAPTLADPARPQSTQRTPSSFWLDRRVGRTPAVEARPPPAADCPPIRLLQLNYPRRRNGWPSSKHSVFIFAFPSSATNTFLGSITTAGKCCEIGLALFFLSRGRPVVPNRGGHRSLHLISRSVASQVSHHIAIAPPSTLCARINLSISYGMAHRFALQR